MFSLIITYDDFILECGIRDTKRFTYQVKRCREKNVPFSWNSNNFVHCVHLVSIYMI